MSDDPKPKNPDDRDAQKRLGFWVRILIWAKRPSTIAFIVSLLALGTGGTIWAYAFITQKLAPLVSDRITTIVNRPVQLGQVEGFSLSGIRFGRTLMPPTETDPDRLSIEGVKVGFNILPLLFKRTLPVSITLEDVNVYLEQDESGAWLDLNITTEGKPLPLEIPTTIKIPDAEIVLLATGKSIPVSVNLDLTAQLSEQFKRAKYDLEAGIKTGTIPPTPLKKGGDSGRILVKGETFLETGKSKVNTRINNFALTDLNPIAPTLPVSLNNGFLAANLNIELPSFTELPTVLGTLGFRDIVVNSEQLPEKVLANGLLRFQGKSVKLEDIQGSVGAIAAEVSGQVDLDRGLDVAVEIEPFALNEALELAQVEAPVLLDGDMAVNLQLTGPLENPQVAGTVGTTRITRIDAIDFADIRVKFLANLQQFTLTQLRVLPLAGGEITGKGEVKLGSMLPQDMDLAFDVGVQLPVDRIASPYGLPPELAIGTVTASASLRGTVDNPEAKLNWRLPAAQVSVPNPKNPVALPVSGFGEAVLKDKKVRLGKTLLNLGDGSIALTGNGNLETKKWQASVAAASFTLDPFLPVPIKVAIANANAKASGSLDKPDPKDISASGELGLNVEGGTVRGEGRLDDGNIEANASLSQIELNQLGAPVPLTLLAGNVKLSGSLDNLETRNFASLQSAELFANLVLKVADGLVDFNGEVKSGFVKGSVKTSAISLATIAPTLPVPVTVLDSQVNISSSIDSLLAAATSAGASSQKLPTPESLTGIDVNADVRLAVAEGVVNASAQVGSGVLNASVNSTEIDLGLLAQKPGFSKKPGFLAKPGFLRLKEAEVNANASLASLINAANLSKGAIARNELPPPESFNGIDVNADVRLAVAEGLVNAKTQLNSGVLNASVNTTEINLATITPDLPIPVRVLGTQVDANTTIASLINAANLSKGAIARNELPPPESFTGIDVNADVRLAVAEGLVNASAQVGSGTVNASVNTTEINLATITPDLPIPVKVLGTQVDANTTIASLINAANLSKGAIARNELPPPESFTGIDVNADVRLAVAEGLVNASGQVGSGVVNASLNTTEINLATITPDLPIPVRVLGTQVDANTTIASLINAANLSKGAIAQNQLPPPESFNGIDVNADVRLAVAEGLVNATTQLNSGVLNASVNTSEINLSTITPDLPIPVRLLETQVDANASLASLMNAANLSSGAIAQNQLPPPESFTGIDVNADVRLAVAEGLVNATTQLNSGVLNASVNTTEINLATITPDLPIPVRLLGTQVDANASLASLINAANLSTGAIARNELPPPESFTGIDVNADVRLAVAEGLVNAKSRLNSGVLNASVNTSEIDLATITPDLPIPVRLLETQVDANTTIASLINAANLSSGAIAQNQLPPPESFTGIDVNADVRLAVAEGRVNATTQLNSGVLNASVNTTEINLATITPDLPIPVRVLGTQVDANTTIASLINAANLSQGAIARNELPPPESFTGIDVNADVRLAVAEGLVNAKTQLNSGVLNASVNTTEIDLATITPDLPIPVRLLGTQVDANASLASLINAANLSQGAIAQNQLPPPESFTGIDVNADVRLAVAEGLVNATTQLNSGVLNASVNTTEIDLATITPDLPIPVRLLETQVDANASLASLINAANLSQGAIAQNQLPPPESFTGIDVNADVRLAVAEGRVNATTQLNSGVLNASVNTTEIDLATITPDLPIPVRLLGTQVDANASLASLINAANLSTGAIAQNQLPPAESFTGIDVNADVRLAVAEGLVNATTQLNSGVLNASVNTTEIDLATITPDLPIPVRLLGTQVDANASLASLINAANLSQGAIAQNQLPPPESFTGIDVNADVRLAVAEGLVNAKSRLNSGVLNASVNTTEIDLATITPDLPIPVRLLGTQVDANASLASLINAANLSSGAIAQNQLPPPESFTGIDVNADVRLAVAEGLVNAKSRLNSGVLNASVNTTEIDLATITPDLPIPVRLLETQVDANASLASLINAANLSQGAIAQNQLPPPESFTGIDVNADVRLAVDEGLVNANAQLSSGNVKVRANTGAINVTQFVPNLPVPVGIEAIQFNLASSVDTLLSLPQTQNVRGIDANTNLDLVIADSKVNAQARLKSGKFFAAAKNSDTIYIPELSPQFPTPVTLFKSAVNLHAGLDTLIAAAENTLAGSPIKDLKDVTVNGNLDLAIADGRVNAKANVKKGQWKIVGETLELKPGVLQESGFLDLAQIEILNETAFLETSLNSHVNLAGELAPLLSLGAEPVAIQAKKLSVQFGDQSLDAKGSVLLTNLISAPDVAELNLDLRAYSNLETLPVRLPPEFIAKGQVDLDVKLEGKNLISDPLSPGNVNLTGDLRLANIAFNELELDPFLAGPVNIETGKKVEIALVGKRDILAAQLEPCNPQLARVGIINHHKKLSASPRPRVPASVLAKDMILGGDSSKCLAPYLPVSLQVELGVGEEKPIIATGNREGDRFDINLENFPLAIFQVAPGVDYGIPGIVAGDVSANLGVNLFTLEADGNLRIVQPSVGYIKAEEFFTNFSYTDGVGEVPQGYLKLGQSLYEFEGGVNLATSQINGKIIAKPAYVEDILTTFSWYSFQDLARNIQSPNIDSANLETSPIGLPNESLLNQLRRFAEINARLQQNSENSRLPAPPSIVDVRGSYQAEIAIAGTLANPNVDLNVEANDLEWRTKPPFKEVTEEGVILAENQIIPIDTVILQGKFENGFLTVQPMRVEFGDTLISFVGKLGQESTTGKFEMEKLAIDTVRNFVDIPGIKVDGNINANAVLAGTIEKPQIRGDISLTEGEINDGAIDEIFGTFSLSNQRLLFATTQPSSLQVFGSVPAPPIPGENDAVSLNLNIGTKAIALLGLLTQGQIEWLSGEGDIKLSARGNINLEEKTLDRLEATGAMTFKDATLKTATLDEELEINGEIAFDEERIRVDQFAGTFADSILTLHGVLPLLTPLSEDDPDFYYPMTLSLNEGKINLEKLYKGKVGGQVVISGAAFYPIVGGQIRLEDGKAFVPKRDETKAPGVVVEEPPIVPILDNFRIVLGKKFSIDNWPLFNFRIIGDLTVNGSLFDLKPEGIIRLLRGQINLFSSQFFVTRNYDQMVTFSPEWGLDPELNIQLGTVVLERSGQRNLPDSESEILEPLDFSSRPNQINVKLTIQGRSQELIAALDSNSQLLDLVELTSTPARNESEIVSLLGNQFLASIEQLQRLPGDIQNRSTRQLLELAVNSFIIKPYLQELQFNIEDIVTKGGKKIGLEDLRVYPTVEGLYQLNNQSTLGLSYDYTFDQVEFEYRIRF